MRIAPTEAGAPTARRDKQGEIRVARIRRHPAHDQNPRRMGVAFLRTRPETLRRLGRFLTEIQSAQTPATVPPC